MDSLILESKWSKKKKKKVNGQEIKSIVYWPRKRFKYIILSYKSNLYKN